MARPLRTMNVVDRNNVARAVLLLRTARFWLRNAGALRSAARVQKALKSAEGALRHADRCYKGPLLEVPRG